MSEKHNSNSVNLEGEKHASLKFKNSVEDVSFFKTICGNELKMKVAKSVWLSMKTDTVDISITGPFRNSKTAKSSWSVVFGDYGLAWRLKSQFIKGYIRLGLSKIKKPTFDIGHANSYYDINMRKNEFGKESVWRHNAKNKLVKRLSFVNFCDTSKKSHGKQGVIKGIKFLFTSMKKREGPLVVEYLKDHA